MLLKLAISVAGSLGVYALYEVLKLVYGELKSPIRYLPGPPSTHWFYGNLKEIFKAENSVLHEQWVQQYGPTIKYKVFLGMTRLYTTDTTALNHFLTNSNIYQKPEPARYALARMLGRGVLVAEGDEHRQQRKVMNPGFGAQQIRELTEIFVSKSIELRDILTVQTANSNGAARIDILSWLSKATLDIIGLAGFNYEFSNLSAEGTSELGKAFADIFRSGMQLEFIALLQNLIPAFRIIPTRLDATINSSRATMMRIGRKLLQDSKNELAESGFEKSRSRDLLSLLVRANTSQDIPASQRLSDEDVLAQVPTFLVAGHETTSTATTWALFALTQNIAAQKRLREELLTVSTDNPTMDQLNELPYLDCVVRETLRIHAPVASSLRVATQDDVVPLATPFKDVYGMVHQTLIVKKGQTIMIPILAMNRDKTIWGPDAKEFIPERWESRSISNSIPGVWGHMLTFLGGPRACIGYRFSLVEMKALLFTLVRAFEFELAVPAADIEKKTSVVQRPIVKSEPEAGNQMPLIVKPYIRS
ncbi:cytochrome P450 [Mycena albidolilacea]|uniref:Cytochrome P450 n=1 Tax=Mycena albidolilacea TaxID=1033008 RepID=A0AAD6ZR01_9AGAR|nr:cytochrome P450 [Mycena albidolilacea]